MPKAKDTVFISNSLSFKAEIQLTQDTVGMIEYVEGEDGFHILDPENEADIIISLEEFPAFLEKQLSLYDLLRESIGLRDIEGNVTGIRKLNVPKPAPKGKRKFTR